MANGELESLAARYRDEGFVSGIEILTREEAQEQRRTLERAEVSIGPLHYRAKVHTVLSAPFRAATLPKVLDIVEALIGPDILLYNVTYIVKEPGSAAHVSWHQDLTYWGLSHDDQVSMWLALSPATEESGCMRMLPGSHRQGRLAHEPTPDRDNVLLQGQTVRSVDESRAITCALEPGQASFHHGWTLHHSLPNRSGDRRIGLNVQYLAAHVRQTKDAQDSALLVRGSDRFRHFTPDLPAAADLDPAALARQEALDRHYRGIAGTS